MTARKERNLRLIDGKWYLDFTFRGQRVRKFGGFTKDQAKVALAKERLDRRDIELGLKKAPDEDVSFATFADEFLKVYCRPNKKSWRRTSSPSKASRSSSEARRFGRSAPRSSNDTRPRGRSTSRRTPGTRSRRRR